MRPDLPDLQSSSQPVPTLRLLPCFLFLVSVSSRLSPPTRRLWAACLFSLET